MPENRDSSAAENMVSTLRQEILDGTLAAGSRLGQELLAERFGASRMPVREALRRLEAEGLVSIVPNSGAWVASLDAEEFAMTYRLRQVVEPFAVQESVPRLTERDVADLEGLCAQIAESVEEPAEIERFLELDRAFHRATYRGIRHRQLDEIVQRIWNTTQQFRRVLMARLNADELRATQQDHELILDSIKRGDAEAASHLVWVHIHRTQQTLERLENIFD